MNDATVAPSRRFPLLVGTSSFRLLVALPSWLLLGSACALLLTVTAADLPLHWLGILARALSLFAMLLCLSPVAILAQLGWIIDHVHDAVACRACDVELGPDSLRVLGGPARRFRAKLSDLTGDGAIQLESGRLRLRPAHGAAVTIDLPGDPDERASFEALAASLKAMAAARALGERAAARGLAPPKHAELEILRCSSCGAPLTPCRQSPLRCPYCDADNIVPAALVSRLESHAVVDRRRRTDDALCAKLSAQPGPALANAVAFSGGALSLVLTAIATFLAAMMAFLYDDLGGPPHWGGIALAECGLGSLLLAFVRSVLANRTALRILTLGFSAIPSAREGATDRCRNCGAPLPEASPTRVLIRCVYCDADNLGSLDLGLEAALIQRFSSGALSPARALTQVRRGRWRARAQGLLGAALMCTGVAWQLDSPKPIRADARTVTLPTLTPASDDAVAAASGAVQLDEEATFPGKALAILPNGDDVDVVVPSPTRERHRLHAPHGRLDARAIAEAESLPFGAQYAARDSASPLLVATTASFICAERAGTQHVLYGNGSLADPLIEDPQSTGGCSGLVTTRAGDNGHYRVRQIDGFGIRTLLVDARQAALAPDGRTLIASVLPPLKDVFDLALFAPGSAPRLLTRGAVHAGYATWSPDGRRVAFLTVPVQDTIQYSRWTGATQLFVLDLAGHLSQLTDHGELLSVRPVWNARGIYVAHGSVVGARFETQLLRVVPK